MRWLKFLAVGALALIALSGAQALGQGVRDAGIAGSQ